MTYVPPIRRPSRHLSATALAFAAILAAAFNLRIGIAQIGPVIEEIRADTGMSSGLAGVLNTIPFACMGAFAFAGAFFTRRFGGAATIVAALGLLAGATLLRSVATAPLLLLALTVPVGVGIAIIGVALPAVIKEQFAGRAAGVIGAYIASLSAGATVAALVTVPLAHLLGGWRVAFAVTALLPIAALVLWLPVLADARSSGVAGETRKMGRPTGQALALAAVFGFQSIGFASMITWMSAVYIDAGWSLGQAAFATASIPFLAIVASLVVPLLTTPATRPLWVLGSGLMTAFALVGIAFAPRFAAVVWLALFGVGAGAIFPLVMTLPLDLRDHAADVAELTGWMLGLGYLFSGTGPVLVGALRDATGDFTVPLLAVAACLLAAGLLGLTPWLRRPAAEPTTPARG